MVFDRPSPQIIKTTVWASPHNPCASSDTVLLPLAFWGKSYEGKSSFCQLIGLIFVFFDDCWCKKKCILMVFDPPSPQIAKITVWASPANQPTNQPTNQPASDIGFLIYHIYESYMWIIYIMNHIYIYIMNHTYYYIYATIYATIYAAGQIHCKSQVRTQTALWHCTVQILVMDTTSRHNAVP